jgi:HD-like signal output (HDOD) protein
MTAWLSRLIPTRRVPPPARREPVSAIATAADAPRTLHADLLMTGQSSTDLAFLAWLLQSPADARAPLGTREEQALQHLARLVADPDAHAHLLPRAAAVVPQLLARLRAGSSSLSDLEQLVSRDITLVAEVIGMANSPCYRRGAAVVELAHAIQVLGIDGLRTTIARVVLKPLIDARGGELVARSARRLWEHTDRKAQLCAALARGGGTDPLEAYVLALAHSAAWNVTLRTMDTVGGNTPWRLGATFVATLARRRDQLLAIIARQWQLPESAARVATDVGQHGLTADASEHVLHLYGGDQLASQLCLHDGASATAVASAVLDVVGKPAQTCFRAFAQSPATQTG